VHALLLARWQFGITTVYHFLFVPLTIGTAFLTAILQTQWLRTGERRHLRATKFWGRIFLIDFVLGVATGIVQQFQYGMAWTSSSRLVGDALGGPLAVEGLLAFFLESTFVGLWVLGWDRLPRGVHTACIWIAAAGTALSAYFVLAAEGWLRHPVGYTLDPVRHAVRLTSIWAVLGNSTAVVAFAHTVTVAFLISGMLLVAGSAWHLRRGRHRDTMLPSMRLGLWSALIGGLGTVVTGVVDGGIIADQQPLAVAAAEALRRSVPLASFPVFTTGSLNGAPGDWPVQILGLRREPAVYHPVIPATEWSFGLMIGFGLLAVAIAIIGLWHTRAKARCAGGDRFYRVATWAVLFGPIGAGFGWIFTEVGRRPGAAAYEVLGIRHANTPTMAADTMWVSLIVLTLLYALLAVVEVGLMLRTVRRGPAADVPGRDVGDSRPEPELGFAY
jgi:cytochrome d ubiquinol oxidase subunit I